MRIPRVMACLTAVVLAVPAALTAQKADTGPADDAGVTTDAGSEVDAARERLHLLLLRPDVRRTARDRGIDLTPIHDGIETLGPAALAQVEPYANDVEAMEGQSAVTISNTTIIIGLLLIILIVLIV